MVATSWPIVPIMTPGTNSMLRARRKDKDIRPNRLLDRTSSRGMLYENEELRLRTININADLEKGQQYIKKLRRENNQLRREIWNLRDQYDKLESMIRIQEHDEYQIAEMDGEYGEDEANVPEMLSVVEEEIEIDDSRRQSSGETDTIDGKIEDTTKQLANLGTVEVHNAATNNAQEVIDNLETQFKDKCQNLGKGVRLTGRNCYLSFDNVDDYEILADCDLKLRDKYVKLENLWERSTVVQLSAVPQYIADEQIISAVSRFADVVGNVERHTYKGFDTGERFLQINSPDVIPYQLLLGSVCVPITILHPRRGADHRPSIARRKSFRSAINISLKTPDRECPPSDSDQPPACVAADTGDIVTSCKSDAPSFFSKSTGVIASPATAAANGENIFEFPSSATAAATTTKKKANGTTRNVSESPSAFRKFTPRRGNSLRNKPTAPATPADASAPPSPAPPSRFGRKVSVNFRNGFGDSLYRSRGYDYEYGSGYMRERSASDASSGRTSICRRKLSVTGHENDTKIPWCGCWGIGCC